MYKEMHICVVRSSTVSAESKTALKRFKKFFHTVRFISKLRPFSESYFAVKGAALILPQNDHECTYATRKITRSGQGEIQSHLQSMFHLLRQQDTIKVAVKLESSNPESNRYMAVVSCLGRQDTEESVILGIDCEETATIGLVFPIWADADIKLEGDGGFTVSCCKKVYVFKPVSVQAMWSALQTLNKVVKIANDNRYIPSGLTHTWVGYYESKISSSRLQMTEWNTNEEIEFFRSHAVFEEGEDEETAQKKIIRVELKNVMMRVDLDEASPKSLRTELEAVMKTDLEQYKGFIDSEMLLILGQLDLPTLIKDYLFLGSEWNASNMEELKQNGVDHILNISKEIDNFFPGTFIYLNIREWDSEESELIKHWEDTYKFIAKARQENSKVLVHCKMGISRSASTVMAYLMKEYAMTRQEAFDFVKEKRSCIMPNRAFWAQLETYEGILAASRQREVFKSKSAVNLTEFNPKEENDSLYSSSEGLLGHDLFQMGFPHTHSLPGTLEDSVFLAPLSSKDADLCNIEADFELSSRSADSADDSLSDHPSPKAEEEDKIFCIGEMERDAQREDLINVQEAECNGNTQSIKKVKRHSESGDESVDIVQKRVKPDHSWIKCESVDDTEPLKGDQSPECEGADSAISDGISKDDNIVIKENVTNDSSESNTDIVDDNVEAYQKENIPWKPGTVKKTKQSIELGWKDGGNSDDNIIIVVENEPYQTAKGKEMGANRESLSVEGVTVTESNDNIEEKGNGKVEEGFVDKEPISVYQMEDISLPAGIVRRTTKEIEERSQLSVSSSELPSIPLQRSSSLKGERVTPKHRKKDRERRRTCTPIISPRTSSEDFSPRRGANRDATLTESLRLHELEIHKKRLSYDDSDSVILDNDLAKRDNDSVMHKDLVDQDLSVYRLLGEEISVEKGIVQKQKKDIEEKNRTRLSSESKDVSEEKVKLPSDNSDTSILRTESLSKNEYPVPKHDAFDKSVSKQSSVAEDASITACDMGEKSSTTASEDYMKPSVAVSVMKSTFEKTAEVQQGLKSPTSQRKITETNSEAESSSLEFSAVICCNKGRPEGECDDSEMSVSVSERKENFESLSNQQSSESPELKKRSNGGVAKKWSDKDNRSNIDSETLALIREIGSAILNSPAKSKPEEIEEDKQGKCSLVRHFVRDIERRTQAVKKPVREILIVDKEMQERQKKLNRFRCAQSSADKAEVNMNKSEAGDLSPSPGSDSQVLQSEKSSQTENGQKSSSEVKSIEQNSETHIVSKPVIASDLFSVKENVIEHGNIELDENHIDKVRNLVGKFEVTDGKQALSYSSQSVEKQFPPKSPLPIEILSLDDKSTTKADDQSKSMTLHSSQSAHCTASSDLDRNASLSKKEVIAMSSLPIMHQDTNPNILSEESIKLLQLRRNLRKTSLTDGRPKSAEMLKRSNTSPGYSVKTLRGLHEKEDESESFGGTFTWEGKKLRKMQQGKSHPLTKLRDRRSNPFYNTM